MAKFVVRGAVVLWRLPEAIKNSPRTTVNSEEPILNVSVIH
jgi:hypothetical protein